MSENRTELSVNTEVIEKIAEHSHSTVVTAPTCTTGGYTTYTCECGDTYVDDEVPENGHSHEAVVTKPATHFETGIMTYTCHCGDTYTETIGNVEEHEYTAVVTEPTCIKGGYTTYTCECGDAYIGDKVSATGHSHEAVVTTPATHLAEGLMTYTCHCGDTYTETIEKLTDHGYVAVVTPPTCTEGGYTTYTCICGDTYVGDEVPANGHSHEATVTAPTCTEGGYTTYTCICGDTYVGDEVPANGHSHEAAVTTPATHIATGVMTYTCACGDTYTEVIAKIAEHSHKATVTAPTCTTGGYTTYTCICGDTYVADEKPALEHDIVIDEAVEATCTQTGLTAGQHCSRCDGATVAQETVPAVPHSHEAVYNSTSHWKECSCGDKVEVEKHSFTNNVCACGYERIITATLSIKNNTGSKTINYGETLKLTAVVTDMPDGAKIAWYVNGEAKGEGEVFELALLSGTAEVTAKLVDENGDALIDSEDNEITDSETVTVNAGFFQKLISFFKNLFRISRIIIQSV